MILAYHAIFSMYGVWLPNDPRGSGSDYVANWELHRYGKATKTYSRVSMARHPRYPEWQVAAKNMLKFPPVEITGQQALAIAHGFANACDRSGYRIHACAILPTHVHLVIGAHVRRIRAVVGHLKGQATVAVKGEGLWFDDARELWGAHGWNVELETVAAVQRAIRYVEDNPVKERKNRQRWSFVVPFDADVAIRHAQQAAAEMKPRRIGGAALQSAERARFGQRTRGEARRKRRG